MGIEALSKMVYEKYLEKYGRKEMQIEQVLVFPDSVFQELGFFKGVSREAPSFIENPKFWSSLHYMPRPDAEIDPSFKQIIPYCVLKFGKHFFIYRRTKKGGEARLHDKYSIGVGGHINPVDGEPSSCSSFHAALLRELQEEVSIKGDFTQEPIGLIYDDSNEVGKVHFGVVVLIELGKDVKLKSTDPALDSGTFVEYDWLQANAEQFENWSQLVIKELLHD